MDLLSKLDDPSAAVRARTALRLGWLKHPHAADAILARLPEAVDELCPYVDALGLIGDARAIPAVREIAARKLLSRRRSGVEALYNLEDAEGLAVVHQRALGELPGDVQTAMEQSGSAQAIAESLKNIAEPKRLGLYLDTLYELAEPAGNQAIRRVLDETAFDRPFVWRYVKSLLKRATLRRDFEMLGWLARRIERQALSTRGQSATVKSGYDGKSRPTPIFRKKTQQFIRRANWRFLRKLARYRPEQYAFAAAEAVIPYSDADARVPKSRAGRFADCYLLHRVMPGESDRLKFDDRKLRFLFVTSKHTQRPANVREEAYPELWDASPVAYLRILAAAPLPDLHRWAWEAVERSHPDLLAHAKPAELLGMLSAPYEETVHAGLNELHNRFDAQSPDWELLDQLLKDQRDVVLNIARDWIRRTVSLWVGQVERCCLWLSTADAQTRELIINEVTTHLTDVGDREHWADEIVQLLESGGEVAEGPLRIARWVLLDELTDRLSLVHCLQLVANDSPAIQGLGAAVLVRQPVAFSELGHEAVLALAEHETAAVRRAAQSLIAGSKEEITTAPAVLFALAESRWEDNRGLASGLLTEWIDWRSAGIERYCGLLDSHHADVFDLGRRLVKTHIEHLDPARLAGRLTEHPHPRTRRFTLEMLETHLPDSATDLEAVSDFFRKGLLENRPDRKLKTRMLEFLAERGEKDRGQAVVAMRILEPVLRVATRIDFELALAAVTRLKLAHPDLPGEVQLKTEAVP